MKTYLTYAILCGAGLTLGAYIGVRIRNKYGKQPQKLHIPCAVNEILSADCKLN